MLGNVDRVILVVSFEKAIHKNLKKKLFVFNGDHAYKHNAATVAPGVGS